MNDIDPELVGKTGPDPEPQSAEQQRLSKKMRTNLINRRTTAFLLEMAGVFAVPFPILYVLYLRNNEEALAAAVNGSETAAQMIMTVVTIAYYLIRDLPGKGSLGKRLVGLEVAAVDSLEAPTTKARILRGVPLAIPYFGQIIEFFAAYRGNDMMQRFGDKIAGTYIADRAPERFAKGSFTLPMIGAFIALGTAQTQLPNLVAFWAGVV